MFCKNCGKEIDDKAAICVHCGVNIKNSQSEGKSWITTLLYAFSLVDLVYIDFTPGTLEVQ